MPVPHGEEHFRGRVGRPPDLPDPPDLPNLSDLSDPADRLTNHDRMSRHLARSRLGLTERQGVSNKHRGARSLVLCSWYSVRSWSVVRPLSGVLGPRTKDRRPWTDEARRTKNRGLSRPGASNRRSASTGSCSRGSPRGRPRTPPRSRGRETRAPALTTTHWSARASAR